MGMVHPRRMLFYCNNINCEGLGGILSGYLNHNEQTNIKIQMIISVCFPHRAFLKQDIRDGELM